MARSPNSHLPGLAQFKAGVLGRHLQRNIPLSGEVPSCPHGISHFPCLPLSLPARAARVSGKNTGAASSHRLKASENPRGAGLLRACTATSWTKRFLHRIPPAGVTNSAAVAFLLPKAPSTGPLTAENPGCLGMEGACLQNQGFAVHSSPERRMFPFLPAALCKLGGGGGCRALPSVRTPP